MHVLHALPWLSNKMLKSPLLVKYNLNGPSIHLHNNFLQFLISFLAMPWEGAISWESIGILIEAKWWILLITIEKYHNVQVVKQKNYTVRKIFINCRKMIHLLRFFGYQILFWLWRICQNLIRIGALVQKFWGWKKVGKSNKRRTCYLTSFFLN